METWLADVSGVCSPALYHLWGGHLLLTGTESTGAAHPDGRKESAAPLLLPVQA